MSQFMKALTNAVSNHVTENNLNAYIDKDVIYNNFKFSRALLNTTGVTFGYTDIDKFVDSNTYLLALINNISYNSDESFKDFVYIITCIANRSLLKNECELNSIE